MIVSDAAASRGDIMRRLADLERQLRELAAGRRLEAATIGAGGVRVKGGSIRIQDVDGEVDLAVLSSTGITIDGTPLIVPGAISVFAGPVDKIPAGWLLCDGAEVSRTDYANLFAAIGTTWGAGDGSSTFNLPDLRDRVLLGAGLTFPLGSVGGATSHSHTNPPTSSAGEHSHSNPSTGAGGEHSHSNPSTGSAGGHTHSNPDTGSAGSHSHSLGASNLTTTNTGGAELAAHSGHSHVANSAGSHTHSMGSTGSAGGHTHSIGETGTQPAHTHSMGSTGTEPAHSHSVGNSSLEDHLPPYAAVLPIIRT